jgi:DNA adenine methylase
VKPFLRWAGSKAQILPSIKPYWKPTYRRYVEPFCGSASLFLSIQPQEALLSDLNGELICTLEQVRLSPDLISEYLSLMPTDEESYYAIRAISPETLSPIERATRFIYLNTLCFNGLYRTNQRGAFNVPYGSKHRKKTFNPQSLQEASRLLKNTTLEHSDFEAIVDRTTDGDFIYLDPPYVTSSVKIFNAYGEKTFSENDLNRLVSSLENAANRGVKFVLSYADAPEIFELCSQWKISMVRARRNIAGFADARRQVNEVLITNCE